MDYLYISPEFPPNYVHFIEHLHSLGISVWGMGEADFYHMPERLRSALTWYVRADLNNADAVQHALDELLMQKHASGHAGNFDLVESHNEQWLTLEGFINEKYGLDGIKQQDLGRLKKKSIMKQLFKDCGLPVLLEPESGNDFFTSNFSRRLSINMSPWKSTCGRRAVIPPICLTSPAISTSTGSGPNCWFIIGQILIIRGIFTAAMPAAKPACVIGTVMRTSRRAMAPLWSRSKASPGFSAVPWAISAISSDLKVWTNFWKLFGLSTKQMNHFLGCLYG